MTSDSLVPQKPPSLRSLRFGLLIDFFAALACVAILVFAVRHTLEGSEAHHWSSSTVQTIIGCSIAAIVTLLRLILDLIRYRTAYLKRVVREKWVFRRFRRFVQ
jgi:hypothetical protein